MIHPSTNAVLSTALLFISSTSLYIPSVGAEYISDDIDPLTAYNNDNESRKLQLTKRQQHKLDRTNSNDNSVGLVDREADGLDNNNLNRMSVMSSNTLIANNGSGCESNPTQCGCPSLKSSDYRGSISITKSNTPCKAWPRIENNQGWGLEDGAFCRNPHHAGAKPWCFKENGNWEYCNVEECVDDTPANLWIGADATKDNTGEDSNHGDGCVSIEIYDAIAADFTRIADAIDDEVELTHFIGVSSLSLSLLVLYLV